MLSATLKILALGAAFWFLLSLYERWSVYPLDKSRISPVSLGFSAIQEVGFEQGNETLVLWVAEPRPNKPVIIYFHGNGGNLANRAERFARFTERGYGLVAMGYRGSSGSSGRPSEKAITADATALYDRIAEVLQGTTPNRIIVYGESLGSGVAARLLSLRAEAQPLAVILEAPFTSVPDVARHHMPWTAAFSWKMTNRWETAKHITAVRSPLFILHGDRDQVVPFEQGQRVFDLAASENKSFFAVEGAGHDDLWRSATQDALWKFIDAQSPTSDEG